MGQFSCPFCRTPIAGVDDEEYDQQLRNRVVSGDAWAMCTLAEDYASRENGIQKDEIAAMRLLLQAAETGDTDALCTLAKKAPKQI